MLSIEWENSSCLYHWPESKKLKMALENKKTIICYTMPGLKSDEKLTTSGDEEISKLFSEHFGRLSPELNGKGISKLMRMGQLEAALNATTVLLSQMGQGLGKIGRNSVTNETTLQLWSIRFQLMMSLKMQQQTVEEMNSFEDLDAPDLYFQYYANSNRKGTMVPFSLRLIHAEVLRFTPFPWKAVERIGKLKSDVEWVINDLKTNSCPANIIEAWNSRLLAVEKVTARILYTLGEYIQAMDTLDNAKSIASSDQRQYICLDMMRMAMSSGDDTTANAQISEAASIPGCSSNDILIHKALRAMFLGAFPHASEYIQRLVKTGDERSIVPNMLAICLLYTGKAVDGVEVLSKVKKPLPEYLMTNIRAMSELGLPAAQKDTLLFEITSNV